MTPKVRIFLSYAREDRDQVKAIYRQLQSAGFEPWMDIEKILPGEDWASCIQEAIRESDFFLACLSANSVSKRGFLQKEIKEALDAWSEKLDHDIYLIPVRLEACQVPERLRRFQWVDWVEETGPTKLVKAIQEGMKRRGVIIEPTGRPESGGSMEMEEGISRHTGGGLTGDSPRPGAPSGPEPIVEERGGCSGRIGTKMVGAQIWYRELPSEAKAAVITGIVTLLVAVCGLGGTLGAPIVQSAAAFLFPQPTPTPPRSEYQVRVEAKGTGAVLGNAQVTIEIGGGQAPKNELTDTNGVARVPFEASLAGQPARLIVEVEGYKKVVENVDLTANALPHVVQLEPVLSTPTDTPIPTSTPAGTPTPTHTPSPAPSASAQPPIGTPTVPPATPTLPPTITPTPTPDCRDVQVSLCLGPLVDPTPAKQKICTTPPATAINLQRSQIAGLKNLGVQAVLTGTNASRCICSWQGRADGGPWRTKTGLAGDHNFSFDIPPQVHTIDVQITIGDRQKITLFTVKVDGQ